MPERHPSEYSPEELRNIEEYNRTGTRQVEREPFKPSVMFALLIGAVLVLGGVSLLIGWLVEPYL